MRKNQGITLISLVITIVILLLLSSITITIGTDAYDMVKVQNFISKMKVIQGKVDDIAEEIDDVSSYGFTKLSEVGDTKFSDMVQHPENYNIDTNHSWNNELDGSIENYYYFTETDLENQLGLKDQDMTVIINFKTRNIIAKKGVNQNKKWYYRAYDLKGGEQLIDKN